MLGRSGSSPQLPARNGQLGAPRRGDQRGAMVTLSEPVPPGLAPELGRERRLAKFRQNVARFRLYRRRFLQENMSFAAFFKIYQIIKLKFLKFGKILQILRHLQNFAEFSRKLLILTRNRLTDFLLKN